MNLLNQFDKFATHTPVPDSLRTVRAKAVAFLQAKGLPTRKDEEWKYTSVKILNDESFTPAGLEPLLPSHETLKFIQEKLNPSFINIVFHNGSFNKTLSSVEALPAGVQLAEVQDLQTAESFADAFDALNAAYFTKNYILDI